MRMRCKMVGHRRSDNVWYDGLDFRADCRNCGTPMLRDVGRRVWRAFEETDADPARLTREAARDIEQRDPLAARPRRG